MARASARRAEQDALTAQYALQMCGECTLPDIFEGVHVGGNEASVLYLCLGSAPTDNITRLVTIYDSHARRALASAGRKQDSEGEDEDWVAAFVRDCLARVHFLECATSLELMAAALSIGTCCPRLHCGRCHGLESNGQHAFPGAGRFQQSCPGLRAIVIDSVRNPPAAHRVAAVWLIPKLSAPQRVADLNGTVVRSC